MDELTHQAYEQAKILKILFRLVAFGIIGLVSYQSYVDFIEVQILHQETKLDWRILTKLSKNELIRICVIEPLLNQLDCLVNIYLDQFSHLLGHYAFQIAQSLVLSYQLFTLKFFELDIYPLEQFRLEVVETHVQIEGLKIVSSDFKKEDSQIDQALLQVKRVEHIENKFQIGSIIKLTFGLHRLDSSYYDLLAFSDMFHHAMKIFMAIRPMFQHLFNRIHKQQRLQI